MSNSAATNWFSRRYQTQRACTCVRGNRSSECASGWHVVDSHDSASAALRDARECETRSSAAYRVVDAQTGDRIE